MQKHYNYLDIDLNKKVNTRLKAKQGDSKSRYILVNLISNSAYYDLSDCAVKIYGIKKDKTIFFNHATVINGKQGQFEVELTTQALAVPGEIEIQILILGTNDEKLTTFSFFIDVEKTIVDDAAIESTNEFTALTEALSSVQNIDNKFNEVNEQFNTKANKEDVAKISSGTPLFASSTTEMIDTTRNYVNTTDGYLYIYSSGSWVNSNVKYQETGISNGQITSDKFSNDLKDNSYKNITTSYTKGYKAPDLDYYEYATVFTYLVNGSDFNIKTTIKTNTFGGRHIKVIFNNSLRSLEGDVLSSELVICNQYEENYIDYNALNTTKSKYCHVFVSNYANESTCSGTYNIYNKNHIDVWISPVIEGTFRKVDNKILFDSNETYWINKKWYACGTSITSIAQGKYVPIVTKLGGFNTVNLGIPGGNLVTEILEQEIKKVPADADLVTVEGGVNDWYNNVPLGKLGDTTSSTFYGALYQAFEYLTKNTNAKIVAITMHGNRSFGDFVGGTWSKNLNGVYFRDFTEALIKMAKMYSIEVIDFASEGGFNEGNYAQYLVDQIHHNDLGGEVMGEFIWSKLKSMRKL